MYEYLTIDIDFYGTAFSSLYLYIQKVIHEHLVHIYPVPAALKCETNIIRSENHFHPHYIHFPCRYSSAVFSLLREI